MEVKSSYRYARISAFKAREVTREIQGLSATDALDILRFTPRKAAGLINKTLKSAIANAENNNNLRVENLVVKEAVVGEGPTMRRFIPKARGSAGPILKRMSHIFVTLTDEIPIERREKKKKKASGKKSSKSTSAKSKPAEEATEAPESTEPNEPTAATSAPETTQPTEAAEPKATKAPKATTEKAPDAEASDVADKPAPSEKK